MASRLCPSLRQVNLASCFFKRGDMRDERRQRRRGLPGVLCSCEQVERKNGGRRKDQSINEEKRERADQMRNFQSGL